MDFLPLGLNKLVNRELWELVMIKQHQPSTSGDQYQPVATIFNRSNQCSINRSSSNQCSGNQYQPLVATRSTSIYKVTPGIVALVFFSLARNSRYVKN